MTGTGPYTQGLTIYSELVVGLDVAAKVYDLREARAFLQLAATCLRCCCHHGPLSGRRAASRRRPSGGMGAGRINPFCHRLRGLRDEASLRIHSPSDCRRGSQRQNLRCAAGLTMVYGASRQATEDLSLMRSIPGMSVVDPCDALDTEQAVAAIAAHKGPVYMRLLRGKVPLVLDEYDYKFELGKSNCCVTEMMFSSFLLASWRRARFSDNFETRAAVRADAQLPKPVYLRFGKKRMPHLPRVDSGFELGRASLTNPRRHQPQLFGLRRYGGARCEAVELLDKEGITCRVLSLHTVKPLDEKAILNAATETGGVITVKEHSVNGGLGEPCAGLLLQEGIHTRFKIAGFSDEHTATGSQEENVPPLRPRRTWALGPRS
jgi:transketolase C-terminal domain/subunit